MYHVCSHPDTRDLVTGNTQPCDFVRNIGLCGRDGSLFEEIQEEDKSYGKA